MRWSCPPYILLLVAAPVAGIAVSRIAASLDATENATEMEERQCVREPVQFAPLKVTSLRRRFEQPKKNKTFPASWRVSKRQGLRKLVTTLYTVHLHEALPILEKQLPPSDVLNYFFRCRGFGTVHPIDDALTNAVVEAAAHFNAPRVEVISAYRSQKFNDSLAKKGRHVASESKHTKGMALDIRIVNAPAKEVGKWMFEHFEGGVGTYSSDNFVHIDTGPKRRWRGR